MDEEERLFGTNVHNDPLHINHGDLKEATDDSIYKKICPVCNTGWLLVSRSFAPPYPIVERDYCTACGQHFIYDDADQIESPERLNRK